MAGDCMTLIFRLSATVSENAAWVPTGVLGRVTEPVGACGQAVAGIGALVLLNYLYYGTILQ